MAETILAKGIRVFAPNAKAPEFVKGTMVITLNELVQFGKDNPDYLTEYNGQKQLKLQLLESKQGGLYVSVDTYKPGQAKSQVTASAPATDDDLPF